MTHGSETLSRVHQNEHLIALLASCSDGDDVAFEELYRLSSAHLYGVLLRILRIEALAEEVLQESFVKIWQNCSTYSAQLSNPMTWMTSIARHQALDMLRKRRSRESNENQGMSDFLDSVPDTSRPYIQISDDASLLIRCLEELPEHTRNCIVRAYCEGYSQEELAQENDTPVNTVKSWLRRGLIALRDCVNE